MRRALDSQAEVAFIGAENGRRLESPSPFIRVSRRKLRPFWLFEFQRRLFGPGDARVLQASYYMALRIVKMPRVDRG
ncbi:hypothetical protein NEUTE1DRAFT_116038 [Neurospora tetrasperma FGSC 2508]|uniref:Uncharacterized protein n=1 Tax=Neurospora tetrasperma (strain FGSC 2508 / ATCC MYA-4615 / P0657) TaxID=510951 RepID=F8MC71_NEUT8|nr:uncharacterized protein NEUTE1DRAFT_116038 [Neurospora tetrasperma FGSC 2508]EGO61226.1 hypothetical protein NEUTE1DRAFT_116038 [Neurospora tetrasperma FGSC 2508]